MEMIGLFILGLLLGVALAWYLQERYRTEDTTEREAMHETRLKQLQDEVVQADSAHAETKERLIALQMQHKDLEQRAQTHDAELAQLRARCGALQDELARLKGGGTPPPPAPTPEKPAQPSPAAAAPSSGPNAGGDDLTRIKGIGRVIEKKLHALGITSFRQLAEMSGPEIRKVNEAIEFPGRVERERWVEQARDLMAR
jgi:large subunit ribosomal protein L21